MRNPLLGKYAKALMPEPYDETRERQKKEIVSKLDSLHTDNTYDGRYYREYDRAICDAIGVIEEYFEG